VGSDREAFGKIVRDVWVATARELLPDPKQSWLVPWEQLDDEFQREVDMRIGEAVAAAERERTLHRLLDGDPSLLESTFRQFVDDEEAADCGLAVAELLRGEADGGQ
jgi:hypothetical protein